MNRIRVLFVDDDPTLQILAGAMMNVGVFDVATVTRTAQADTYLEKHKVDIVVCDVMMPEEDGLSFCKRLRAAGNRTPVLMLSAVSDPRVIRQATEAGATDYLVKPFDIHALQRKILTMLNVKWPAPASGQATKKSSGIMKWLRG